MNNFLIIFLFISLNCFAKPAQITIIRHAEKDSNSIYLSTQGLERAEKLISFFESNEYKNKYGEINYIFAANPKDEDSSVRSIQTATPIANYLHLNLNKEYLREDYAKLANELITNPKFNNKNILIVWPHKRIVELTSLLTKNIIPKKWSDKVYDRAWIIKYNQDNTSTFFNIPQRVLESDSQD